MAVPVRTELLAQTLDLERRALRCFSRSLSERRKHLLALARALPRADSLFAMPRQRFDRAADSLANALRRNLQEHRRAFIEAAVLIRAASVARRIDTGKERTKALAHRLDRSFRGRLAEWSNRMNGVSRLLESVSHKAVLERGFAFVRGADGAIRRRAAQIVAGERLMLTFADGSANAYADGGAGDPAATQKGKTRKREGQGNLF
jgi:exodeoxyribonuclease VII large subunit